MVIPNIARVNNYTLRVKGHNMICISFNIQTPRIEY